MERIIVMGGSYNPPTIAHGKLMQTALDSTGAEYDGYRVGVTDVYCLWDVINWCDQIRDTNYDEFFLGFSIGRIEEYGMAFSGKKCMVLKRNPK